MKHTVVLGLLLFVAGPALAQETIRLTVVPAAEPSPALRYALLPELRDITPGNAALLYYRAFLPEFLGHRRPEVAKKLYEWRENPSNKPPEEFKWVLRSYQEFDRAAFRSHCDWDMIDRFRKEGWTMRIPEFQSMRDFGNLLALRARFEMDAGEHEKVARTIQTGLTLGRHVAEGPILIQGLVGLAISQTSLTEVEQWIQRPGAPNLYWSLTNLPTPFIDLRKPMQGERIIIDSLFPGIREAIKEKKPERFSIEKFYDQIERGGLSEGPSQPHADGSPGFAAHVMMATYAAMQFPKAKKMLRERGWTEKEIAALPVTSAVLMMEVQNYDRIYDDCLKWSALPYPLASAGIARVDQEWYAQRNDAIHRGAMLARALLPAFQKITFVSARLDRRIAMLRCVEALRLYGVSHNGELPAQLSDITDVPIPLDPVFGKTFGYERNGNMARLHSRPPAGFAVTVQDSVTYEIILKK